MLHSSSVKSFFFESVVVIQDLNALVFIPTYKTVKLTPQHVFLLFSRHRIEFAVLDESDYYEKNEN